MQHINAEQFVYRLHSALGTRPTQDDMYMPKGLAEALAADAAIAAAQTRSPRTFLDTLVARVEATVLARMSHPHARGDVRNKAIDCALDIAGLPPLGNRYWRTAPAVPPLPPTAQPTVPAAFRR